MTKRFNREMIAAALDALGLDFDTLSEVQINAREIRFRYKREDHIVEETHTWSGPRIFDPPPYDEPHEVRLGEGLTRESGEAKPETQIGGASPSGEFAGFTGEEYDPENQEESTGPLVLYHASGELCADDDCIEGGIRNHFDTPVTLDKIKQSVRNENE